MPFTLDASTAVDPQTLHRESLRLRSASTEQKFEAETPKREAARKAAAAKAVKDAEKAAKKAAGKIAKAKRLADAEAERERIEAERYAERRAYWVQYDKDLENAPPSPQQKELNRQYEIARLSELAEDVVPSPKLKRLLTIAQMDEIAATRRMEELELAAEQTAFDRAERAEAERLAELGRIAAFLAEQEAERLRKKKAAISIRKAATKERKEAIPEGHVAIGKAARHFGRSVAKLRVEADAGTIESYTAASGHRYIDIRPQDTGSVEDGEELMTVGQAAKYIGMNPWRLRRDLTAPQPYTRVDNVRMYRKKDLQAFC